MVESKNISQDGRSEGYNRERLHTFESNLRLTQNLQNIQKLVKSKSLLNLLETLKITNSTSQQYIKLQDYSSNLSQPNSTHTHLQNPTRKPPPSQPQPSTHSQGQGDQIPTSKPLNRNSSYSEYHTKTKNKPKYPKRLKNFKLSHSQANLPISGKQIYGSRRGSQLTQEGEKSEAKPSIQIPHKSSNVQVIKVFLSPTHAEKELEGAKGELKASNSKKKAKIRYITRFTNVVL